MYDKRAGIAIEEIRGMLTFVLAAIIILLFFYGCNLSKVKTDKEEFSISREEINSIRMLNNFLDRDLDSSRSVLDMISESYESNDYAEFDQVARQYFSGLEHEWRMTIQDGGVILLYDSNTEALFKKTIAKYSVELPITDEDDITFIEVTLQVFE